MTEPHLILGLGELLWDVMPEGPRLGGAPANFTVMAGRLGNHAAILSRIGWDDSGRQVVEQLKQADPMPADAAFLQLDPEHETGRVTVHFEDDQPRYTIHEPAAWDFLELTDKWTNLAERADAICFGSLAQRGITSRETIQTLAALTPEKCVRVFDVNLRAPFYTGEVIQESLELSTVLKMNHEEVPVVLELLGLPVGDGAETGLLRQSAERLLGEFPALKMVAVTRGGKGSLLVTREEWHEHAGVSVELADTVGAGDAFTAALTHYMLRGADLKTLNEAGNRWGGWVASQKGGMPVLPDEVKTEMEAAIEGLSA